MRIITLKVAVDGKDVDKLSVSIDRLNKSAQNVAGQRIISNLTSRAITEAIGLTTRLASEITDLAVESVKLAADYQGTTNALAVFTGSIRSARQELSAIDQVALNTTGLRLTSAEQGYERLRALGFQADTTTKLIKGIANQKLLSNADEAAVSRVIVNLTQIRASTKDGARDIKEMIKAIPSLSGVFEDTFGTSSTSELRKLLQENPKAFFDKFATGLATAEQAQGGLNEAVAKGGDAFIELGRTFGEPILDPFTNDIKELTGYVRQNKKEIGEWGEYVANTYRGISALAKDSNTSFGKKLLGFAGGGVVGASGNLASSFKIPGTLGFAANTFETVGRNETFEANLRGGFAKQISQMQTDLVKEQKAKQKEADRAKLDQQEESQKALLENFKSLKNEQLSISESLYKVEESRLKSHLDYTTEAQLQTLKQVSVNQQNGLTAQIAIAEAYFNDLVKFGDLDKDQTIKAEREKNISISKLNGELRANEYNTQKEILEFEKRIQDERREAAISLKKLQIEQSNFGFDNQIADIERLLSNQFVSAKDGYDKIIELTQESYQEASRLSIESYQLQLQDLSLTKEKRLNLTTEMFLSEQKLAEENRRKIQQIEGEKFQNSLESFKRQTEQIIKLSNQRGQSFGQLQGSFFNDSISFGQGAFDIEPATNILQAFGQEPGKQIFDNIQNVITGRMSIYEAQKDLLEKTHKVEITNLEREIDLNKDLIELERIKLKGQISSNIVAFQSNRASLLNQAGQLSNNNPEVAQGLTDRATQIGKTIEDWQNILSQPESDLNAYFDRSSTTIKQLNSNIQETTQSVKTLGLAQAGAKQGLFSESAEGLKQLYEAIKTGQKDKIIQDIEERNFLKEKISLITENKALELAYYKDSEFLAEQRKNKLLGFERQIFEARQELANKPIFNQAESDAKVFDWLNSQVKGSSEIFADFRIGLGETYLDAITSPFDALSKKLEGLNPIARGLAQTFLDLGRDIVKAFSQKIIMQLLGLGGGNTPSGSSSGGNWFSKLLGGLGVGGSGNGSFGGTPNFNPNLNFAGFGGGSTVGQPRGGLGDLRAQWGFGGSNGSGGSSGFSSIFGSEGFGNNVGTYGAVGAGAGILGGLIGGRVGGFISGAGAGLGIGAQIGSMIMPGLGTALGAGIGALAGGLMSLLGGDPKRKADKKQLPQLAKGFADAFADFNQLIKDSDALRIKPPSSALDKGIELRNQIATGFGLTWQSKKYRQQSQQQIKAQLALIDAQPNGLMEQLRTSVARAKDADEFSNQFVATFATGGFMDDNFAGQYGDFKRRNGFLTGGIPNVDSLPSLLMPREIVINETQQERIRRIAGFDVFAFSGVPNYPTASKPPIRPQRMAAGGFVGIPNLSGTNTQTNDSRQSTKENWTIHLYGVAVTDQVKGHIESPDGKRQVINIVRGHVGENNLDSDGLPRDLKKAGLK